MDVHVDLKKKHKGWEGIQLRVKNREGIDRFFEGSREEGKKGFVGHFRILSGGEMFYPKKHHAQEGW